MALCFRLVRSSVSASGRGIPDWPLAVDFQFSHILTLLLPVSVGWASGRASGLKNEWWSVSVVICLELGADCLHAVQLMPLHPNPKTSPSLAWFKSRLLFTFPLPAYSPSQKSGCSGAVVLVVLLPVSVSENWKSSDGEMSGCDAGWQCMLLGSSVSVLGRLLRRNWLGPWSRRRQRASKSDITGTDGQTDRQSHWRDLCSIHWASCCRDVKLSLPVAALYKSTFCRASRRPNRTAD